MVTSFTLLLVVLIVLICWCVAVVVVAIYLNCSILCLSSYSSFFVMCVWTVMWLDLERPISPPILSFVWYSSPYYFRPYTFSLQVLQVLLSPLWLPYSIFACFFIPKVLLRLLFQNPNPILCINITMAYSDNSLPFGDSWYCLNIYEWFKEGLHLNFFFNVNFPTLHIPKLVLVAFFVTTATKAAIAFVVTGVLL